MEFFMTCLICFLVVGSAFLAGYLIRNRDILIETLQDYEERISNLEEKCSKLERIANIKRSL